MKMKGRIQKKCGGRKPETAVTVRNLSADSKTSSLVLSRLKWTSLKLETYSPGHPSAVYQVQESGTALGSQCPALSAHMSVGLQFQGSSTPATRIPQVSPWAVAEYQTAPQPPIHSSIGPLVDIVWIKGAYRGPGPIWQSHEFECQVLSVCLVSKLQD